MPARNDAWALGHDIALAALSGIANELRSRNRLTATDPRHTIGINSPILDRFPVRQATLSGVEAGGGTINHELSMVMTTVAYQYVLTTYFAGGTVTSVAMTLYTLLMDTDTYARYNCEAALPGVEAGDLERLGLHLLRVRFRFLNLRAL